MGEAGEETRKMALKTKRVCAKHVYERELIKDRTCQKNMIIRISALPLRLAYGMHQHGAAFVH